MLRSQSIESTASTRAVALPGLCLPRPDQAAGLVSRPPLGLHLLLGPVFKDMAANMVANLNEDRIALLEIICRKS